MSAVTRRTEPAATPTPIPTPWPVVRPVSAGGGVGVVLVSVVEGEEEGSAVGFGEAAEVAEEEAPLLSLEVGTEPSRL